MTKKTNLPTCFCQAMEQILNHNTVDEKKDWETNKTET